MFVMLWKDYRTTVTQMDLRSRTYGQVTAIQEVNGEHEATGDFFPLRPLTRLGRSPTNNIVIDDSFASGEHARIVLREGQWWLEDRNSRNGTMLNGTLVNQPVVVTDGDLIGIGEKLFRFDLE
jgi:hypothetical protein